MRIKKVSETTSTQAQVVDGYSASTTNSYSCNYVNNVIKDVYSTDEVKTNKVWINSKPIYRKVIARNQSITNGTSISVSSLNIDELIKIGAINQNQSSNFKFFGSYYDSSSEKLNIHLNNNDIQVWSGTGVNYTSTIWVEYTKTTDSGYGESSGGAN